MKAIKTVEVHDGFKSVCPYTGCSTSFTKPTKNSSEQAVRMHAGRTHRRTINIPQLAAQAARKAAQVTRRANRVGRPRKTTEQPGFTINFCPGCGFDIRAFSFGAAIAQTI